MGPVGAVGIYDTRQIDMTNRKDSSASATHIAKH